MDETTPTAPKKSTKTSTWTSNATYKDKPEFPPSLLDSVVNISRETGNTVQIFGDHGIGKSAGMKESAIRQGLLCIKISAQNVAPDDLTSAAPIRIEVEGKIVSTNAANFEMILQDLLMDRLRPGQPFVIIIDDSNQAHPLVQSQLMQLTNNWTIGSFDLKKLGCVAVIALDNASLAETNHIVEDLAMLDRKITFEVTDQDTAWPSKIALAAKYSDVDLKDVFAVRDSLPKALRFILSWRTLDHAIDLMINGHPGFLALPVVDGQRMWLDIVSDGKTVARTKEVFSKIAQALGVPYTETVDMVKLTRDTLRHGWSTRIIGPHGIGKTEMINSAVCSAGYELVYWSLPVTDFDAKIAPVPSQGGHLKMLLSEELLTANPKVIVLDEANRPKDLLAMARSNQVVHDREIGDIAIPGLQAVFAMENPPEVLGRKYSVQSPNVATADRYHATVIIDAADMPWQTWMRENLARKIAVRKATTERRTAEMAASLAEGTDFVFDDSTLTDEETKQVESMAAAYQSVVETFLEWYNNDLDNDGRAWMSPRGIERMINAHVVGAPLESAKIWLAPGEFAPVPLANLQARLANRPVTGMRDLTQNLDEWIAKLSESGDTAEAGNEYTDMVNLIFTNADAVQLREHMDTVVALVKFIPTRCRLTYFVDPNTERQKFWMEAFRKAKAGTE